MVLSTGREAVNQLDRSLTLRCRNCSPSATARLTEYTRNGSVQGQVRSRCRRALGAADDSGDLLRSGAPELAPCTLHNSAVCNRARGSQIAISPASTCNTLPVMNSDRSLAQNSTTRAHVVRLPRTSQRSERPAWVHPSGRHFDAWRHNPGWGDREDADSITSELQRQLAGDPDHAVLRGGIVGHAGTLPRIPATDERLTITPPWSAPTMRRAASRQPMKVPPRLMPITRLHSASERSRAGVDG